MLRDSIGKIRSKALLSVVIICLLLTSPSSVQVRRGSLVVFIVSQRADYVVIGAESRTLGPDDNFLDDRSCKVISLGGDTLFFETGTATIIVRRGKSWSTEGTARSVYTSSLKRDALSLSTVFAERAFRWFHSQPESDLRTATYGPKGTLLTGGFINFGSNATLSIHSISLNYDAVKRTLTAEPASQLLPGQVGAAGVATDLVGEFFVGKTDRAIRAFGPIGMVRYVGVNPLEDVRLVRTVIEFAMKNATRREKSGLGGDIDIAIIRNNGTIQWVSRKPWCSQQDLKLPPGLKHK